jgi:hypothetical protein
LCGTGKHAFFSEEIAMLIRTLSGIAIALVASSVIQAQDTAVPVPRDDPQSMPREAPPPPATRETTTYPTEDGKLVVHTSQPGPPSFGPAPAFDMLAHGKGYISSTDAGGYPLLANDFIYADGNRDGRISQSEYERWARAR